MLTAMIVSYTVMRKKGFRLTPFGANKLPALGGIYLAGWAGWWFGLNYGRNTLGSNE